MPRAKKVKTTAGTPVREATYTYQGIDKNTGLWKEPESEKKVGGNTWVKQAKAKRGGYAKYQGNK